MHVQEQIYLSTKGASRTFTSCTAGDVLGICFMTSLHSVTNTESFLEIVETMQANFFGHQSSTKMLYCPYSEWTDRPQSGLICCK